MNRNVSLLSKYLGTVHIHSCANIMVEKDIYRSLLFIGGICSILEQGPYERNINTNIKYDILYRWYHFSAFLLTNNFLIKNIVVNKIQNFGSKRLTWLSKMWMNIYCWFSYSYTRQRIWCVTWMETIEKKKEKILEMLTKHRSADKIRRKTNIYFWVTEDFFLCDFWKR